MTSRRMTSYWFSRANHSASPPSPATSTAKPSPSSPDWRERASRLSSSTTSTRTGAPPSWSLSSCTQSTGRTCLLADDAPLGSAVVIPHEAREQLSRPASFARIATAYVVALGVAAAWLAWGADLAWLWLDTLVADLLATLVV